MPSSAMHRSTAVPMTADAARPSACVVHDDPSSVETTYSGFVIVAVAVAVLPSTAKCSVSTLDEPSKRSRIVRPALPGAADASHETQAESVRAA